MKLPKSKNLVLDVLLKNARQKSYRIWAVGSGFEKKDVLKNRGYKWFRGGEGRVNSWHIEIDKNNLQSELEYLKKEIYGREINLPVDPVTPFDRFSERL